MADHGWLTDNWIGLIVLLCMFVTMEVSLAMMAFRLISRLPHHIPAMVGMSRIGRIDSDRFADDTTGRGIAIPREKASKIAEDVMTSIGGSGDGRSKNVDNPSGSHIDLTVKAYMHVIGRAEE